jgi:hypothetical protein
LKHNVMLTISTFLSLLFTSFHHADDVVRGLAPGKFSNIIPIVFLFIWLYATMLVLEERRSGYITILVVSILAIGLPIIHMTGAGMSGGRIANSTGAFFFVWTLVVIGVTALFSAAISARALWSLRRERRRS